MGKLFNRPGRAALAGFGAAALAAGVAPWAARAATTTTPTTVLTADVPHVTAAILGSPAPDTRINIGVLMQGQDPTGLATFIKELETPGSPEYGHPLTPAEYQSAFGVTPAVGSQVRSWLGSAGLKVPSDVPALDEYVFASGTVGEVSKLLHVQFADERVKGGQSYIANLQAPTVPADLGITRILGLNTSLTAQLDDVVHPGGTTGSGSASSASSVVASSGPAGTGAASPAATPSASGVPSAPVSETTNPSDLWQLYNEPSTDLGQGQQLATLLWGSQAELDPTVGQDLLAFEVRNGLRDVPQQFVWQDNYVDPGASSDTLDEDLDESDMDAQASVGMAPDVSALTMYYADDSEYADLLDVFGKWVNNPNGALQMSASFGGCETVDLALEGAGFDSGLAQAVAEGRTVFVSSGDQGSGCQEPVNVGVASPVTDVQYPASSPYAVAVGGTVVTADTHTSALSEYGWTGSGGGTSFYEPAPSWQGLTTGGTGRCITDPDTLGWPGTSPIGNWLVNEFPDPPTPPGGVDPGPLPSNESAEACRGVPDVAAQSGDLTSGYNIIAAGSSTTGAGTSLAAPLWQGMWARIQAAHPANKYGFYDGNGFAAPLLYKVGENSTEDAADFNDITVGNNGLYTALPGWDYMSGWGSPNLTNLMTTLDGGTTPTDANAVIPPLAEAASSGSSGSGGSVQACQAGQDQISGQPNSATSVAGEADTGEAALSQADLDVLSGNLSWDPAAQTLTATIVVQNLSATPPGGMPTNEYFRYYIGDSEGDYLVAERTPYETVFDLDSASLEGSSTAVTGSFDTSDNTITITMPDSALPTINSSELASGDTLDGMSILAQRDAGVLTLTADSLSATCAYTLPGDSSAGSSGSGTTTTTSSTTSTTSPSTTSTTSTTTTSTTSTTTTSTTTPPSSTTTTTEAPGLPLDATRH